MQTPKSIKEGILLSVPMATGLSRMLRGKVDGFFRLSFNKIRTLSTSALSPESSVTPADLKKPKRRKQKNLLEVAQFLPNWGIGYKVAKSHWRDVSYEITKINLYKDGRHGKAWGIRYKAGLPAADAPVKLSGVNKPGWRYLPQSKSKLQNSSNTEVTAA